MSQVSELKQTNAIYRSIQEASIASLLAGMMLSFAMVCVLFGASLGFFVFNVVENNDIIEELKEEQSIHAIYYQNLHSWAKAHKLGIPKKEDIEQK